MASEAQISMFLEYTGGMCDKCTAEEFIRSTENLEKALASYFDDPNPLKFKESRTWNEASFAAGRDPARSQIDELPPYQMDDDDREGRTHIRPLGAPSRPPSRERSRLSLRSGRDVDMQQYGPHLPDDEDAEMAEAIRLSMEDQHSGVISTMGREYVPDLELQERVRQPGEPAFLKPLPSNVFLPQLITILHSIAQCREMFLSTNATATNYGENRRWWEGESIETSRVVDRESAANTPDPEVVYETQRLMAFLDNTDRAYGSAAALSRLSALHQATKGNEPEFAKFIRAWQDVVGGKMVVDNWLYPFRSTMKGAQGESRYLNFVDIEANDIPKEPGTNLYEALDNCFWPDSTSTDQINESGLTKVAKVMVMHIAAPKDRNAAIKLVVPETLFADRYLESNKHHAKEMRVALVNETAKLKELQQQLEEIDNFPYPGSGKKGDVSNLLHSAIKVVQDHQEENREQADSSQVNVDGINSDQGRRPSLPPDQLLLRLQQVHESLQTQAQSIREDQERIRANMRKLKSLFTTDPDPANPSTWSCNEYKLRGVGIATASQSSITYIKHPSFVEERLDRPPIEGPWWRISYDTAGDKALVTKEKVSEQTVLDAAGELLSDTILVYASEYMLMHGFNLPLTSPLQKFVAIDNAAFNFEITHPTSAHPAIVIEGQPLGFSPTSATDRYISSQIEAPPGVNPATYKPSTPRGPPPGMPALLPRRNSSNARILGYTPSSTQEMQAPTQMQMQEQGAGESEAMEMQEIRTGEEQDPEPDMAMEMQEITSGRGHGPFGLRGGGEAEEAESHEHDSYDGAGDGNMTDSDTVTIAGDSDVGDVEMEGA